MGKLTSKKFLKKDKTCLYAMAKEAYHLLGNVSRDKWDLIQIYQEDKENYYGNWVYGWGLIEVRFPKNKIRTPNKKELRKYDGSRFGISGNYVCDLEIKDRLWKKP